MSAFTKEQAEEMQRRVEANSKPLSVEEFTRRMKAGIPVPLPSIPMVGGVVAKASRVPHDPFDGCLIYHQLTTGHIWTREKVGAVWVNMSEPIIIDIDPIGAPRQTRRDAWKPSPAVQRYRAWKDKMRPACDAAGWKLGSMLHADFEIAMPASWSKKKKAQYLGSLHHQKPDIDNLVKSVMDLYGTDDGHVSALQVTKRWAEKGRIILYR